MRYDNLPSVSFILQNNMFIATSQIILYYDPIFQGSITSLVCVFLYVYISMLQHTYYKCLNIIIHIIHQRVSKYDSVLFLQNWFHTIYLSNTTIPLDLFIFCVCFFLIYALFNSVKLFCLFYYQIMLYQGTLWQKWLQYVKFIPSIIFLYPSSPHS
jgi:hypothetical protein